MIFFFFLHLQTELEEHSGNNELMEVIFQQYLGFMRSNQSEVLQKHIFAAWRSFIRKVLLDTVIYDDFLVALIASYFYFPH